MHRECDAMIMKAAWLSNYTILFATHFMSNPIVYQADSIRKDGKFTGASNGAYCTATIFFGRHCNH